MKNDDIEKLFSSLEDFSKIPPDDLWKGIEEKLDNPIKKKEFPFWWCMAASLVVGLGLLATFYFNSNQMNSLIKIPVEHENGMVNQLRSMDSLEHENAMQEEKVIKEIQDKRFAKSNLTNENKNEKQEKLRQSSGIINSNKSQVSQWRKEEITAITKNNPSVLVHQNENKTQAQVKGNEDIVQENKIVAENKKIEEKSIPDTKEKQNLAATDLQENALATLVKEKDKEKKEKTAVVEDKWSLQLFAGINNSQNLKNQKSLGNTIESQKGLTYGVKTNYKLNKRWAVSTGIKVSELGQQVANVSYVNSATTLVNIQKLFSVAVTQERGNISNNANYQFITNTNSSSAKNMMSSTFYETGNLSQKVQYLEMPMEISYALLNKGKARINMNTGGFVGKVISNQVLLNNSSIGENSDVNDVVFGTILSSTLQYELFNKTKVFVEPGMNYYTQPVQNQNFNQFQLIFNFGLNVSF